MSRWHAEQTAVLVNLFVPASRLAGWSRLQKLAQETKSFYGSADVNPATAKMRLVQLAGRNYQQSVADPLAELKITVEINANFPNGASDR